MKEILVYLDDYKYSGEEKYDVVYLDFRTIGDYNLYIKELELKQTTGTYIEIDGYRSPKRLVRGAYYALNLDMLKVVPAEENENTLIIARTYNFSNYSGRNDKSFHLLQTHEPLDPDELNAPTHNNIETFNELTNISDLEFRVNDVSQANWNEVRQGNMVKIVYDIGAPITESKKVVRQYINQFAVQYANDHPCLVLSHWDKDHYHCLLEMTDAEIKCFSRFICIDKMKSAMSQLLFQRLLNLLGSANVYCRMPWPRTLGSDYPLVHKEFSNGVLSFYTGESSRNTNYTGVLLFVRGGNGNVIFTGDCLPCQANEVLQDRFNVQDINTEHYCKFTLKAVL